MKVIPSIFFILLLSIFTSCNETGFSKFKDQQSIERKVKNLISDADQEQFSFSEKASRLDSAITLSSGISNNDLLWQAAANKALLYTEKYPDSTKTYIDQLAKIALQSKSFDYQGYVASLTGDYYYNEFKLDSAYHYYKASNTFYLHQNDSLRVGYNFIKMSEIYSHYDDYANSEEAVTNALKYLKTTTDTTYLVGAYNLIGKAYYDTKNYDKALQYYDKALELAKEPISKIILENNKASVYIDLGQEELALKKLLSLFPSQLLDVWGEQKAVVLYNIGHARFKINKKDGLSELEQALHLNDSLDNIIYKIENLLLIAEFFKESDKRKSIALANEAVLLSNSYQSIDNKLVGLKMLIRLTNPEESKKHSLKYLKLNDSITDLRGKAKNQFAKMRYDYSHELEQNLLLKANASEDRFIIQKQKNTNIILVFTFIVTVLIIIFLYYILRGKHKREKIEEAYKAENRIATKIHDELANDIYNTIAYTENTDFKIQGNKVKLLDNLENVYSRTRNISKENSSIDIGENYISTLKNMLSEYQKEPLKIILVGIDSIHWSIFDKTKKIVIYRILQELMVNMKKHSKASMVVIKFELKNKKLLIQYSDNGIGFPKEKTIFKNGLKNAEIRIKTIRGTITFDSNDRRGLKVIMTYPL